MTGYLKDYTYDDRLRFQQPPFLFDLGSSSWRVVRETLCVPGGTVSAHRLLTAAEAPDEARRWRRGRG